MSQLRDSSINDILQDMLECCEVNDNTWKQSLQKLEAILRSIEAPNVMSKLQPLIQSVVTKILSIEVIDEDENGKCFLQHE